MFENAKAFIGKHPYAAAGIFFGLLLLLYILSRGGSSTMTAATGTNGPTPAEVQAGYAFQAQQIQQQTALAGINAQVQEHADQLTAQIHAIDVGSSTSLGTASIGATLQGQLGSLSAQIAELNSNNQLEATRINDTLSANLATIASNTTLGISANQTQIENHLINVLTPPAPPAPPPPTLAQREDTYIQNNPDVATYYSSHYDPSIGGVSFADPWNPGKSIVVHSPEDFATVHYLDFGKTEGRAAV